MRVDLQTCDGGGQRDQQQVPHGWCCGVVVEMKYVISPSSTTDELALPAFDPSLIQPGRHARLYTVGGQCLLDQMPRDQRSSSTFLTIAAKSLARVLRPLCNCLQAGRPAGGRAGRPVFLLGR